MCFMQAKRYIKHHGVICKITMKKKIKEFSESKPKGLKKALKSLGLPNNSRGCIINALADNQIINHNTKF